MGKDPNAMGSSGLGGYGAGRFLGGLNTGAISAPQETTQAPQSSGNTLLQSIMASMGNQDYSAGIVKPTSATGKLPIGLYERNRLANEALLQEALQKKSSPGYQSSVGAPPGYSWVEYAPTQVAEPGSVGRKYLVKSSLLFQPSGELIPNAPTPPMDVYQNALYNAQNPNAARESEQAFRDWMQITQGSGSGGM